MQKSLKDISWVVPEETYREDPAYSYSTIARFVREGFQGLPNLFTKISTPSLTFGSMVDTLLLEPEGTFEKRFLVATFPEISDTIKQIVGDLFSVFGETGAQLKDISSNDIISACDRANYGKTWNKATRINKVLDGGGVYYNLLKISKDKEIVSSKQYEDAMQCVEALKTSRATSRYFQPDNPFDGIERLPQLKFKGKLEGEDVRCMMDLAVVDHEHKIIYPCDLKTSSKPEYLFYKSFMEWNYMIQASLYSLILKQNIEKDDYFKDFIIAPYTFIVICNSTRHPKTWKWNYLEPSKDIVLPNGKVIKNWLDSFKDMVYYLKNNPVSPRGIKEYATNNILEWIYKDAK